MKALIITDIQNDFLPEGALEVPESSKIISIINRIQPEFDLVVATQDWHPANHLSFASNHPGKKVYDIVKLGHIDQILWPDHCVQGSVGADFSSELSMNKVEAIFRKGTNPQIDSYSAFFDNEHLKRTGLSGYLKDKGTLELYFCGLAADFCVYYSIMDALQEGFKCHLILDATYPLVSKNFEEIKGRLAQLGVKLIESSFILKE